MHPHIEKLYSLSVKPQRLVIGLMSGTSLDGLDVALCRFTGQGQKTKVELLEFTTVDYPDNYKNSVREVFSKQQVDLQKVCIFNAWIGRQHAAMISSCLEKWQFKAEEIDLIASHGQTIYHAPKSLHKMPEYPNSTLQIGDGDHIAHLTGIITISDFRQKHLAAGGEGAPLAVYGDYLIFSDASENRLMLNMGGISNLTYLPKSLQSQEVFSSDIGPGNTMMDAFMQKHYPGLDYDRDSKIALSGETNNRLLKALKDDGFFAQKMPKTTGPELFNLAYLERALVSCHITEIKPEDVMATLNRFAADMIVEALKDCEQRLGGLQVYASGGGVKNNLLMQTIQSAFSGIRIKSTAELGIDPDAKEAVLFAVLANETVAGQAAQFGNIDEGIPSVTLGKISFSD